MTESRSINKTLVTAELVMTGLVIFVLVRSIVGLDGLRTLRMKSAQCAERACMHQAQLWADLADMASHVYEHGRASV